MKLVFVLIGTIFLMGAAAFTLPKKTTKWSHVMGGACAILGLIFTTATPMQEGQIYRIDHGHPVSVLS